MLLRFFIPLIYLLLVLPSLKASAGEIDARVTVDMEMLVQENRINVQSLERDLTVYINNNRFTDIDWQGPPIPVDIAVYLSGGNNGYYSARLFIASKRYLLGQEGGASVTIRVLDNKWAFEYSLGATHSYNPLRLDKFITLIDFYMLLVIGYDMDSYGELEGTPVFEKAKQICQMGAGYAADGFETNAKPGDYTRFNMVSELTDLRYDELRQLFFTYYVDGLDMMAQDKKKGLDNLYSTIINMVKFKKDKMVGSSVVLQMFFDAKNEELASIFKTTMEYPDVYNALIYLDPTHSRLYLDAKEGK